MKSCNFSNLHIPFYEQDTLGKYEKFNYLFEQTKYAYPEAFSPGFWLETPYTELENAALSVTGNGRSMNYANASNYSNSVRPVIEVPINKVSY